MNALEVKISQIKNLNLIYLFNVDSVFSNNNKKYLGIKVVYDKTKYIDLDFKDKEFPILVKKVISRYNQEKDNRNIILLGNLTASLFKDDEILSSIVKLEEYSDSGLGLFNTANQRISPFKPYLKEALKLILEHVRNIDGIEITNIDGFNNKYNVTYKIVGVESSMPIIIYFDGDNKLHFKIGYIEGQSVDIEGVITNNIASVEVIWKNTKNKNSGYIIYDTKKDIAEKNVTINEDSVYHSSEIDVVTNEDLDLVNFYFELFGIEFSGPIMKTDDGNFILGNNTNIEENEDSEVVCESSIQLSISNNEVILNYQIENVIRKLKNLINIPLDITNYEIILKLKNIGVSKYIIIEYTERKEHGKKFDYTIFQVDEIDLHRPFKVKKEVDVDSNIKSYYDLENKLRLRQLEQKKIDGGTN